MSSISRAAAATLVMTAALSTQVLAQSGPRAARHDFAADRLVAPPTDAWPTNGGNLYNQRYSSLNQINASNVAELKGVWRAHLRGSGVAPKYSGEGQPDRPQRRRLYQHRGKRRLRAVARHRRDPLAVRSQSLEGSAVGLLWLEQPRRRDSAKTKSSWAASTASSWRSIGRPVRVVWTIQAERAEEEFSITPAPLYFDGLVITGFAGAERGTRGRVKAFDARDGKLVWTFYTIPGPGEPGHETWPQDNDSWKYGGGDGVADAGHRSRARSRLFLDGQRRARLQRRRARGRQPVHGRRSSPSS